MKLYNFIKIHPRNEKNSYFTSINIVNNARSDDSISTM